MTSPWMLAPIKTHVRGFFYKISQTLASENGEGPQSSITHLICVIITISTKIITEYHAEVDLCSFSSKQHKWGLSGECELFPPFCQIICMFVSPTYFLFQYIALFHYFPHTIIHEGYLYFGLQKPINLKKDFNVSWITNQYVYMHT